MVVALPTRIFNDLTQVVKSGLLDNTYRHDYMTAYNICKAAKCDQTAMWIMQNPDEYIRAMHEGMEIDNSQDNQLREIHQLT